MEKRKSLIQLAKKERNKIIDVINSGQPIKPGMFSQNVDKLVANTPGGKKGGNHRNMTKETAMQQLKTQGILSSKYYQRFSNT
jgi:hypothetical protein